MGAHDVSTLFGRSQQRAFIHSLLEDLQSLERMLAEGLIEQGPQRIGAEQEVFLTGAHGLPVPTATEVLSLSKGEQFCTEVGRFNMEANLTPRVFASTCLTDMEAELRALLGEAARSAREVGARVVLAGVLPSLERAHLVPENMTPGPRYEALNRATLDAGGGEVHVAIKGIDDFEIRLDSMMLESCLTSFQVHLQVSPESFAESYNAAQVATAPLLAVAANSPLLLGKRLWHETRIPLFESAAEFRTRAQQRRGEPSRVSFGGDWVHDSVVELFREDVARHRILLAGVLDESSSEALAEGHIPKLRALSLHNGTIWRWNRPCYGVNDGHAHLRIENRVIPAGPTAVDEMANAAFWLGLVVALPKRVGDLRRRMAFSDVRANFIAAARQGLDAEFTWLDGERLPAARLIVEQLLPLARTGLESFGIRDQDIERYLGIIEARVLRHQTGALWLLEAFNSFPSRVSARERGQQLAQYLVERSLAEEPVHTWPAWRTDARRRPAPQTVGQIMQTNLHAVHPDDSMTLAAHLVNWYALRVLPVESEGRLVGVLPRRALLRWLQRQRPGAHESVAEFMARPRLVVPPQTSLSDAVSLLLGSKEEALLVIQGDRELIGIVTEVELARVLGASAMAGEPRDERPSDEARSVALH